MRWPEAHASPAWTKAHHCVHVLEDLVRDVDSNCQGVEANSELASGAIRRRRSEICDQALGKLVNFAAFEIAEKVLSQNIFALERLSDRDPEQVQKLEQLKRGLKDLTEGVEATKRMVLERCKMRERVSV